MYTWKASTKFLNFFFSTLSHKVWYMKLLSQEHAVWRNQQFWEAAFYQDVQREIKALYATASENSHHAITPISPREVCTTTIDQFPPIWPSLKRYGTAVFIQAKNTADHFWTASLLWRIFSSLVSSLSRVCFFLSFTMSVFSKIKNMLLVLEKLWKSFGHLRCMSELVIQFIFQTIVRLTICLIFQSKEFSWKDRKQLGRVQEPSALEIAAEQMRIWNSMDPGEIIFTQHWMYTLAW